MQGYAWVTLATNDAYSLGALVLAHSLRRVGTKYDLVVLVTPGVTPVMREKLAAVFSVVQEVNVLDSKDEANLALLARPELGVTFTKLHCWRLIQYEKCVFVDADTLVVRNCDELFEREELSAAPDVGWPDCFNSGVFVYRPSLDTFAAITSFAASKGSFDGGDQGLLNMYFADWARKDISKHLPFIYNMCSTATYSYIPAFKQFGENVRIIHFIGGTKPWLQYFDTLTGIVQPPANFTYLQPLLQLWWNIFCEKVHPELSPVMAGLAGALAQMTLGQPRSAEQIALEEHMRKQSWEQGQIDYMGRDSFDNIWKKICETLSQVPERQPTPPKETEKAEETVQLVTPEFTTEPVKTEIDKPAETVINLIEEKSLTCNVPGDKQPVESFEMKKGDNAGETAVSSLLGQDVTSEHAVIAASENDTNESSKTEPKWFAVKDSSEKSLLVETSVDCFFAKPTIEMSTAIVSEHHSESPLPKEVSKPPSLSPPGETELPPLEVSKEEPDPSSVMLNVSDSVLKEERKIEDAKLLDVDASITSAAGQEILKECKKAEVDCRKEDEIKAKPITNFESELAQLTIDESSIKNVQCVEMLSTASEVLTVSPVPIQVAESVLQTEPKQSISGDLPVATQEVLSSTITPIHESPGTPSQGLTKMEEKKVQMNGTDLTLASSKQKYEELAGRSRNTDLSMDKCEAAEQAELLQPALQKQEQPAVETQHLSEQQSAASSASTMEDSATKILTKSEQVCSTEKKNEDVVEEGKDQSKEKIAAEAVEIGSKAEPITSEEVAARPSGATKLSIPATPTVTEATPPTSPPVSPLHEPEAEKEKATKKSSKKEKMSEAESVGTEPVELETGEKKKKTTKKVVKKAKSKSLEDTAEESVEGGNSATGKQKKTTKALKKGPKSPQTLGADVPVPETPPPSGSDTPIPPKRKSKSTTAKKPEVDQ